MSTVYQLKVMLLGSKPPIWRRFTINSQATLGELHYVIQTVMGWMDGHMHEFIDSDRTRYGMANMDGALDDLDYEASEDDTPLCNVLKREKQNLRYIYDFGDSWEHQIVLEKKIKVEEENPRPRCLKGKNACPPEDCGGIWGYYNMLEILTDPKHPEYEEIRGWMDGAFDPTAFHIDTVNRMFG